LPRIQNIAYVFRLHVIFAPIVNLSKSSGGVVSAKSCLTDVFGCIQNIAKVVLSVNWRLSNVVGWMEYMVDVLMSV